MTERLTTELRAFHELARVVARDPFDVGDLLERICAEVRQSFGFARAMVVRLDPEARTIHADVQQGVSWPGEQWLLLERFPFLERAAASGEAAFVRDAREEAAMPRKVTEQFDVRSIVGIPLSIEDDCLGFIVGDRAGAAFDLDPHALELLTALGRIVAVFMARADQFGELARSLDNLRRVDAAKSEFVSIASHELRTPIAVVHGITSTLHLRGGELRDDQLLELRATLFEQTSKLSELAEQLLDLSRLEARAVRLSPERFHPRERIDTLLPRLVPDRLADIAVDVDPALELETDPWALDRVLSNLVLNALRYGRPPVSIRSQVNGTVQLAVEDRGEGVEAAFVPRLFERFTRSDASRARAIGGAGLGLSIAHAYARALGGDLTYASAVPTGACFTLTLPREAHAA